MRGPARRIASFCAVTALLAAGSLKLDVGDSPDELAAKLLPVAGIGPWTVGYVSMRVLGAPDVSLANDAAVRNGLRLLDAGTPAANGSAYLARFRPWRSYATMHLWRAAANIRRPRTQSEVLGPPSKNPRQEKTTP
jgi:AraC family transcriptional regulator of adaptative response / DNA-3-methyladenine glycosylase II